MLLLLNYSCQKDEIFTQNEPNGQKKISRINFEEFKKINIDKNLINAIERHADFNFTKSESGFYNRNAGDEDEFVILTDEIVMINDSIFNHYTFKVIKTAQGNNFFNLTLKTDLDNNIIDTKFLKYSPTDQWFENPEQPYDGTVELMDANVLQLESLLINRSVETCVLDLEIVWECNYKKPHAPGEGTSCSEWTWILQVTTGPCPETIDAGGSGGGGTGSDGGGDSGGNTENPGGDGTSTGSTKPTKPCEGSSGEVGVSSGDGCITTLDSIERNNLVNTLNNQLTQSQIDWILNADYYLDIKHLNNYLNESNYFNFSIYSKFSIEAINALMNGGTIDLDNRLIFNPIVAQDYRARMSDAELEIFDELNILIQGEYLKAATQAYIYAETHFSQPVRNKKGDAFKHAFWNALSTVYIGEELTEQLTTAHEDIEYDPNYENHFKETQMDLHNNTQGRQIAYGAGRLYQLVQQAIDNGNLRYLNNLSFQNGFWNATNSSQLTPTNQ